MRSDAAPGERADIGGRSLHYVGAGTGSPTIVFESGGGGGASAQDLPVLRRVAALTQAILYDRAGLGRSDPGPAGRSFGERAGDLATLLAAIGASPPFVLVAGSYGGLFARAFCRRYPDQVAGVVLLDAAEEQRYFRGVRKARAGLEASLRAEICRAASGELLREAEPVVRRARGFTDPEKAALLDVVARPSHFEAALEEMSAIDRTTPDERRAGGFGDLGARPLIVLSHGKPFTGDLAAWEVGHLASQRRLAALSSQSALVVARRNGHSIALENPDLAAAAVAAVVAAVRGQPFDVSEVRRLADRR